MREYVLVQAYLTVCNQRPRGRGIVLCLLLVFALLI